MVKKWLSVRWLKEWRELMKPKRLYLVSVATSLVVTIRGLFCVVYGGLKTSVLEEPTKSDKTIK